MERLRDTFKRFALGGLLIKDRLRYGVSYNPLTPANRDNPYPAYARLRRIDPVHRSSLGVWILTRHEDCVRVLRDHEGFSSDAHGTRHPDDPPGEKNLEMLFCDPPRHTRLRSLVNKAFTPRAVQRLEQHIQSVVNERLDGLRPGEPFDLIEVLAFPLPVIIISEMLGIESEDRVRFKRWSDDLSSTLGVTSAAKLRRAAASRKHFQAYLGDVIEARRREPREDLISNLLSAEEQGGRLDMRELLDLCELLLVAGNETTTNLIGNGMLALLRNPDQLALLRQRPELAERCVEECLRYDAPVQYTERTARKDVVIGGRQISRGQALVCCMGAANHDPERFVDPDRLDITREDNPHLAFGGGIHYCVGSGLARMEGRIAISTLALRFGELRLLERSPRWRDNTVLRGLRRLMLVG